MKRNWSALLLALLMLSVSCAPPAMSKPSNITSDNKLVAPAKYKVLAQFDKKKYFLGENVLVEFIVENNGDGEFQIEVGGDYRGAPRPTRFKIKAVAADGSIVADPHPNPMCFGGLGGPEILHRTDRWQESLALMQYCRIEKPGKYKIFVSHDLGWGSGDKQPEAVAEVEFVMPNAAEASAVVKRMYALSNSNNSWTSGTKRPDFADFSVLAMPVYLPLLLQHAQGGPTQNAVLAVQGIASIPTIEATQALLDLAESKDAKVANEAVSLLAMRVPDPELTGKPGRRSVFENTMKDERTWLVHKSWSEKFTERVRKLGQKLVKNPDAALQSRGAFFLQCTGNASTLTSIIASLDKALSASATVSNDGSSFPSRPANVDELIRAAQVLISEGKVSETPSTPGEMALYMTAIAKIAKYRPKNWPDNYQKFLQHKIPYLRELALSSLPQPVPLSLDPLITKSLNDPDPAVQLAACGVALKLKRAEYKSALQTCLTRSREFLVINSAYNALYAIDPVVAMEVTAARLGENGMTMELLMPLLQSSVKHNSSGTRSSESAISGFVSDSDEGKRIKPLWLKFIADNKEFFRKGGIMSIGDPRLIPSLIPRNYSISDKNHKEWPPVGSLSGTLTPQIGDRDVQNKLTQELRSALSGWTVGVPVPGVLLPDWKSYDADQAFSVEAKSAKNKVLKVCFVPADWVGAYIPAGNPKPNFGDNVLIVGSYKIIFDPAEYDIQQQLYRLPGAGTASLVNSGAQASKKIFAGKESKVDSTALKLVDQYCKTPKQLVQAAQSLVRLGVPSKSVFAKVLSEARAAAGNDTDYFISALAIVGGKDSVAILRKILADAGERDHNRQRAADALRQLDFFGEPESGALLATALKQMKDSEPMMYIAQALANTGYKSASSCILEAFPRFSTPYYQVEVAELLARLHCKQALPQVTILIKGLSESVQKNAADRSNLNPLLQRAKAVAQRLQQEP